jgi:hypothetical protein
VGIAAILIEVAGASGGWLLLHRRGAAPAWDRPHAAALLGCVVMTATCLALWSWPLVPLCTIGAVSYGLTFAICLRWPIRREPLTAGGVDR